MKSYMLVKRWSDGVIDLCFIFQDLFTAIQYKNKCTDPVLGQEAYKSQYEGFARGLYAFEIREFENNIVG